MLFKIVDWTVRFAVRFQFWIVLNDIEKKKKKITAQSLAQREKKAAKTVEFAYRMSAFAFQIDSSFTMCAISGLEWKP